MAPDRLRVTGVVSRSRTEFEGVPVFGTLDELLTVERPEFVIASVPWAVMPDATRELVARGLHTLAETPPAPDLDGLRSLWADVGASRLVQVAEQYLLMPAHAARLAVIRDGAIGAPTSVQVSSTHLYHAVSMIRGLLGVGFEPATVTARGFTAPLADPVSFDGWHGDVDPRPKQTTLATLDFGAAAWASTTSPTTSGGTRCARGGSSCAARPVSWSTTRSCGWSTRTPWSSRT